MMYPYMTLADEKIDFRGFNFRGLTKSKSRCCIVVKVFCR